MVTLALLQGIVNTFVIETRHNERIKINKDIAAAAVGISIFVWLVVLTIEASRFWQAMILS